MSSSPCVAPLSREVERASHILIVDDEAFIRNAFQLYFESMGYRVSVAEGGETALKLFQNVLEPVDVVLLDLIMPGIPGIKLLQKLKELDESVEVIIATGCGTMNSAIEALRHGAYDYITKPILNFDEDLLRVVRGALATRTSRLLQKSAASGEGDASPPMLTVEYYRSLEALARRLATDPEAALESAGKFLERELGIVAGVVLCEAEDGVRCVARWGGACEWSGGSLDAHAAAWLDAIEVQRGWQLVRAAERSLHLLEACSRGAPLEALRVPLRSFSPPGAPRTPSLILFRVEGGARAHAPPDLTLLEIVIAQAVLRAL
jgi:DNA-binding response OmpR family regulator